METKNIELNVDYIGDQNPLTLEEKKAISDFFKRKKLLKSKRIQRQVRLPKRIKVTI